MKILYLHQYFATPESNGGTRSYEMAKRLVAQGHNVDLITSSAFLPKHIELQQGWNQLEIEGIQLHVFKQAYSNKVSFAKRLFMFFEFLVAASRYSTKVEADLVFATSTPLTIAIPGVYYSKIKKVPMVFEVRDLWPEVPIALKVIKHPFLKWLAKKLELFAYKNSKQIVALSPGMKAGVEASGYPSDDITCIPNSCDLDLFQVPEEVGREYKKNKLSFAGDRPLIVYTGTFGMVNNVGYLVDIARESKAKGYDFCFVAIGDGMEKPKVIEAAKEAGVYEDNFYVLDPIPKLEVVNVLSAADLALSMVGPVEEMWKNSANKLFDAFAASRPIAISHGGWQQPLLESNDCGFAFSHTDVALAAQQIADKLLDEKWLESARANAYNLANNVYSRDLMAEKLEDVLLKASR